jgi:hydrogenase maturation protease
MTEGRPTRTAIAGLGNLLLRDDGVGVHAVRELSAAPPDGVEVLDVGTAIFHGVAALAATARVLAIDALRAGGRPGTLYLLRGADTRPPGPAAAVHALGFCAALRFAPNAGRGVSVIVLGVEPAEIGYGMELSPALRAALPRLVASARFLAAEWDRTQQPVDAFLATVCAGGQWTEMRADGRVNE